MPNVGPVDPDFRKKCAACGAVITRLRDGKIEPLWKYKRRRVCGKMCATERQLSGLRRYSKSIRKDFEKECVWCGRTFSRRKDEHLSGFKRRQTCCLKHGRLLQNALRSDAAKHKRNERDAYF